MTLQGTLHTGMSGLLANQMAIDALASNTSNINATGYKKLDTKFSDLLYETLIPGYGAGDGTSATNAAAVGKGTLIAEQTHNFTQGALESTSRTLDFAIEGNGFFVLNGGASGQYLTRNGNFYLARGLSADHVDLLGGDLGLPVVGYNAVNGILQNTRTNISLPALDTLQPGIATKKVEVTGNLSSAIPLAEGNTITAADGWINASGASISDILVGGVQTSAPMRDKSTGAPATAATKMIDLQFQTGVSNSARTLGKGFNDQSTATENIQQANLYVRDASGALVPATAQSRVADLFIDDGANGNRSFFTLDSATTEVSDRQLTFSFISNGESKEMSMNVGANTSLADLLAQINIALGDGTTSLATYENNALTFTGSKNNPANALINLQFQTSATVSAFQNLFNVPTGSTITDQELAINFERNGNTYVETMPITDSTTLQNYGDWLCGWMGDDTHVPRADAGILGLYDTKTYTSAADGFDLAGEQAGCFLSVDSNTGETRFNIASNIGEFNFIQNISLTATSHSTTADGRSQNIVENFNSFSANPKFPVSNAENPVSMYDRKILSPDVYNMKESEELLHFVKLSSDDDGTTWRWYAEKPGNILNDSPITEAIGVNSGIVRFDTEGNMIKYVADGNGGDTSLNFDFGDLTQVAFSGGPISTADGFLPGTLKTYTNAPDGMIYGTYDNGQTILLAQIGLAVVTNPAGMWGATGTLFQTTPSSGSILYSASGALSKNFGSLYGGFLEMSNFQLGADAIIIQRSYQFSSRLVTTANEMMQTVYNLKS